MWEETYGRRPGHDRLDLGVGLLYFVLVGGLDWGSSLRLWRILVFLLLERDRVLVVGVVTLCLSGVSSC